MKPQPYTENYGQPRNAESSFLRNTVAQKFLTTESLNMICNVTLAFGLLVNVIKQVIRGLMNPRKEKKTVHTIILFFWPVFNYVLVLINQLYYLHALFHVFITSKILWLAILFRFSRMDTLRPIFTIADD